MKKLCIDLNSIPEMIDSGFITPENAAKMLAEDLIRNHKKYHLISNDEDIIGELSVRILQSGALIFKNYKKEKGSFKTYLLAFFKYQILTIIRENRRKCFGDTFAREYPQIQYEPQKERYEMDEAPFKIAHLRPFIKRTEDKITCKEKRLAGKKASAENTEHFSGEKPKVKIKDLVTYWANRRSPKAKTALILALKSSYYITDETIDSVCDYCAISKKLMQETIDELKSKIPEKHEKLEKMQDRLVKSFNYHIKLQKQLSEAVETSEKEELSKKYEYHTKKWQDRNSRLMTKPIKLCPTNRQVADVLGIGERQVGNYIKNAETMAEFIIKEINDSSENS